MSDITEQIKAYNAGKVTFDDLKKELGGRKYKVPARFSDPERKKDPLWRSENYDPIEGDEGTWDEVDNAWATNLLTDDEYLAIVQYADANYKS
jgi:hypothetical protein